MPDTEGEACDAIVRKAAAASASEAKAYYPYLFAFHSFDVTRRNTVFALRDRGFFAQADPNARVVGLQRARSVDFAYPGGPNDFSRPGTMTGGQFWRVARFELSCQCWRVVESTFHPSYP